MIAQYIIPAGVKYLEQTLAVIDCVANDDMIVEYIGEIEDKLIVTCKGRPSTIYVSKSDVIEVDAQRT